jgi:hypothetical protein
MLKFHLEKKGNATDEIEIKIQEFLSGKESKFVRAKEKKARRKLNKKVKKVDAKEKSDAPKAEEKPAE